MTAQMNENNLSIDAKRSEQKKKVNILNFPIVIRIVRILGLLALISYIVVILSTWIYANKEGFIYFSAGETSLKIKYSEWILGFLGFFVAIDYLLMELKGYDCIRIKVSDREL